MKVIFLDIDGVLNGHQQMPNKYCGIDPACMERLNNILEQTGAKLVISSAWRYQIAPDVMTMRGFEQLLNSHGLDYSKEGNIVGYTCRDEEVSGRESQIFQWVELNEPSRWIVIDDLPLKFGEGCDFIRTNSETGLTDADAERSIFLLGFREVCE